MGGVANLAISTIRFLKAAFGSPVWMTASPSRENADLVLVLEATEMDTS